MLVRQGEARSGEADRRLAWSLAAIAGALNAAGFYAFGLYSSHMTGTISALADHLALGDMASVALYGSVVASFVFGAAISTLLINAGQRRRLRGVYAFSISAEAVLLAALGVADLYLPKVHSGAALIFGLSFLMGLQNAVVTRISNARIRTTHVTGMVTDIGIELGNLVDIALSRKAAAQAELNRGKLKLHVQTVSSFFTGGVVGVYAYKALGAGLMFGAAALLLTLAIPGIMASRSPAVESDLRA
jgi:uncharacterized membrane protein YoaK (UPF0700 family)